jgi:excisionase family DNA binding protein
MDLEVKRNNVTLIQFQFHQPLKQTITKIAGMDKGIKKITIEVQVNDLLDSVKKIVDSEQDSLSNEPLNKKEASKIIGVSVATIERLMTKSEIPFRKIGGRVIFLRGELITWLKSKNILYGKSI